MSVKVLDDLFFITLSSIDGQYKRTEELSVRHKKQKRQTSQNYRSVLCLKVRTDAGKLIEDFFTVTPILEKNALINLSSTKKS